MKEDVIDIEILPDGTIKSTTPKISAANHSNSAQFFSFLSRITGGLVSATRRDKTADHHHHEADHQKGSN